MSRTSPPARYAATGPTGTAPGDAAAVRRLPRVPLVFGVLCGVTSVAAGPGWRDGAYLLGALGALAVILTGLRTGGRGLGPLLLAVGLALRVLGDVTWALLTLRYGPEVPLPSAGDAFYFAHYLTVSAGAFVLARRPE